MAELPYFSLGPQKCKPRKRKKKRLVEINRKVSAESVRAEFQESNFGRNLPKDRISDERASFGRKRAIFVNFLAKIE